MWLASRAQSDTMDIEVPQSIFFNGSEESSPVGSPFGSPQLLSSPIPPPASSSSVPCDNWLNVLNISTGYDEVTDKAMDISFGSVPDASWELYEEPNANKHVPRPAFAIKRASGSWKHPLTNKARWITSHQETGHSGTGLYKFRYKFCLNPSYQNPIIDIDVRADNYFEVYLNGNYIDCGSNLHPSNPFHNPPKVTGCDATSDGSTFDDTNPVSITISNGTFFNSGSNTLEVWIENNQSVKGLLVEGTLTTTTTHIEHPLCCSNQSTITGYVWDDANANSIIDGSPLENTMAGVNVDITGNGVSTSQLTDATGYYYFTGLSAGTYNVTVTPPVNYGAIPSSSLTRVITIGALEVSYDNFFPLYQPPPPCATTIDVDVDYSCLGYPTELEVNYNGLQPTACFWEFGDGTTFNGCNDKLSHTYLAPGAYNLDYTIVTATCKFTGVDTVIIEDYPFCKSCKECIGSFAPVPGNKYVLSAWVKEDNHLAKIDFASTGIAFFYEGVDITSPTYKAKGLIIEGWQQIEEVIEIPQGTSAIQVQLKNDGADQAYFDDIRIYPIDANLKSFVYDPITLRLTAELDENNYATYYEYDEDGNLIRVKKETSRGIKTIQESKQRLRKN